MTLSEESNETFNSHIIDVFGGFVLLCSIRLASDSHAASYICELCVYMANRIGYIIFTHIERAVCNAIECLCKCEDRRVLYC